MVKKLLDFEKDFRSVKKLFGGSKKSFKQQYAERVKEQEKEAEEQMYKAKLETLDKIEFGSDKLGKFKKKLKDLLK